jgi:hypothetical protein
VAGFISCRMKLFQENTEQITVAALSKAWTVFAGSKTGIIGSNPTRGMDVCMGSFCVYFVLRVGRGLVSSWYRVRGFLPTVCRIKNLKTWQKPNKGL